MFEEIPENPSENTGVDNQEEVLVDNESDEEKTERFQKQENKAKKHFLDGIGDKAKEEKGKAFTAMSNVWGELISEIKNQYNSPDKTNMES